MFRIELIQRCDLDCRLNRTVVADLRDIIGFGEAWDGKDIFITDGDQSFTICFRCPDCGQAITYVTSVIMEGEENGRCA